MSEKETQKNKNIQDNQEPDAEGRELDAEVSDEGVQEIDVDANGISAYVKKDSIWTNLLLAALFCNFLYYYYMDLVSAQPKFSSLLMMVQVFFIIMFFLYRDYPKRVSYSPKDWVVALGGTWLPMLILPIDNPEIPIFTTFQFIGIIISIAGILSLNNSFGIVPAVRKVKTGWMYKFVRHPIYFGYAISFSCMVINNFTFMNLVVLLVVIACDVMRILAEEEILSDDPVYELYKTRVKYRLIPYVW